MTNRFSKGIIAIIIATILMAVVSLPDSIKSQFPDLPVINWAKKQKVILGLDLQGGTQLDYRIDLRNAKTRNEDEDDSNDMKIHDVIEGVRTTIERRVNGLGVSEPQIYTSKVAGEDHIIVELAGIKDVEEAKKVVGKTIQLEFKEAKTEMDPEEKDKIKQEAESILQQAIAPEADFVQVGKNNETGDKKIEFREKQSKFISELPAHYKDIFTSTETGKIHNAVIEGSDGYMISGDGNISEKKALYLVQLTNKEIKEHTVQEAENFEEVSKEISKEGIEIIQNNKKRSDFTNIEEAIIWVTEVDKNTEIIEVDNEFRAYRVANKTEAKDEVKASHILIAYQGAERASEDITRTKDEAKMEAERILGEIKNDPAQFGALAKQYSDGPSAESEGDLGFFGQGQMAPAFEEASFALNIDEVSEVVETDFGFHVIKVTDKKTTENAVDVQMMAVENSSEARIKLEEALKRTELHDVVKNEEEFQFNEIVFDTTPDPWKSTGLDGSHFKFATVVYNEIGSPQVSIEFDNAGGDLFANLTERLSGQQLAIFVGGQLISAPRVNEKISGGSAVITGNFSLKEALQLSNDLNTGAIDAPIILSGQYTISATLGKNALNVSLYAGIIGLVILMIFMVLYYRLFGIFAVIALIIYAVIIVFILKTTSIVMTLAGIAGIILSIGMAVDANILIFERTKEELNEGKNFSASVVTGFERAWSSIRDSNVSSLITCAILWFFGNSIIRGFALMLAIGIAISMFTAINITRSFLLTLTGTGISKNRWLLGAKKIKTLN